MLRRRTKKKFKLCLFNIPLSDKDKTGTPSLVVSCATPRDTSQGGALAPLAALWRLLASRRAVAGAAACCLPKAEEQAARHCLATISSALCPAGTRLAEMQRQAVRPAG